MIFDVYAPLSIAAVVSVSLVGLSWAMEPSELSARRPWRSSVACVFDADCAEIQRSLTGNRQAWSSAERELMPH